MTSGVKSRALLSKAKEDTRDGYSSRPIAWCKPPNFLIGVIAVNGCCLLFVVESKYASCTRALPSLKQDLNLSTTPSNWCRGSELRRKDHRRSCKKVLGGKEVFRTGLCVVSW